MRHQSACDRFCRRNGMEVGGGGGSVEVFHAGDICLAEDEPARDTSAVSGSCTCVIMVVETEKPLVADGETRGQLSREGTPMREGRAAVLGATVHAQTVAFVGVPLPMRCPKLPCALSGRLPS